MISIQLIIIIVIIILILVLGIILYKISYKSLFEFCRTNNFFGFINTRRRNRISPEMFHILAQIIRQRDDQVINDYEYRKKEVEMVEFNNLDKVIILNPDNNIELGIEKKT